MSFIASLRRPSLAATLSFALILLWMWWMHQDPLWRERGGDWMSVAIGGQLVGSGQADALYARTPDRLMVDDPRWITAAEARNYRWQLYPFLYPPLIAYAAAPLASFEDAAVKPLVVQAELALLALMIALTCWQWRPDAFRPVSLVLILLALSLSRPLSGAIASLNIHPLVLVCTITAMIAAQRNAPRLAGCALALAAFIKLVPAVLLLYWIAQRRWACLGWCAAALLGLSALSLAVAGWPLHLEYLRSLADMSAAIVPIYSNKGVPALLYAMGGGELDTSIILRLLPLPGWIPVVTAVAATAGLLAVLARARLHRDDPPADAAGMAATLLIATIATPAAWSHYFTFLAPAFLIWAGLRPSRPVLLVMAAGLTALCSIRAAIHGYNLHEAGWPGWMAGGELAAALLLIVALLVSRERQRHAACKARSHAGAPWRSPLEPAPMGNMAALPQISAAEPNWRS